MDKVPKTIKREFLSDEDFNLEDPLEVEKPEHSGSSNGESDEEGQRDQKKVDSIIAEMDEEKDKEQDKESEEDLRRMYGEWFCRGDNFINIQKLLTELSLLSPAAMAALIQRLEKELYEVSQREARELNRSKHLRIFGNSRRRTNK
ncbi:hypothetical protein KR084_003714 [Drosophila pseudotakahashii]|nr:hypothetical protein KR084_003714 [Drosophila pseudotakahashii]